jgi:toxin-antitoxin system PIN domain toxin
MRSLLDVNLLIALVDRSHAAHRFAHNWLAANRTLGWSTCPIAENGCLRILTNPKYSNPYPAEEVLEWLDEAKLDPSYDFWPDDLSINGLHFRRAALTGHQQVTDIYLLAMAVSRGARLLTFDTGISIGAVAGATAANLLVLPTR